MARRGLPHGKVFKSELRRRCYTKIHTTKSQRDREIVCDIRTSKDIKDIRRITFLSRNTTALAPHEVGHIINLPLYSDEKVVRSRMFCEFVCRPSLVKVRTKQPPKEDGNVEDGDTIKEEDEQIDSDLFPTRKPYVRPFHPTDMPQQERRDPLCRCPHSP